jgi:hypothetical protein
MLVLLVIGCYEPPKDNTIKLHLTKSILTYFESFDPIICIDFIRDYIFYTNKLPDKITLWIERNDKGNIKVFKENDGLFWRFVDEVQELYMRRTMYSRLEGKLKPGIYSVYACKGWV